MYSYPTVEQINEIASLNNATLRNLQITQCYHELSAAFAKRMGDQANWCTFATWASKQAGQTIRREDLQRTIETLLKNKPEVEAALSLVATLAKKAGAQQSVNRLRETALGIAVEATVNRASAAISRGNKKVFEEIGHEFARFMSACFSDAAFLQSGIDDFAKQLQPGLPPNGQDYLRNAFYCYYQALFEDNATKKTELNLLANLEIGFHEQNRLQPEIAEALNASATDMQLIKDKLANSLLSGSKLWTRIRLFFQGLFGKTMLDKAIESLLEQIQYHVRLILTAHLMTIRLPPDNRLQLSKDLTLPFPGDLTQLTNPELLTLLNQIDTTANSVAQSGATDWADIRERMHFIADLFRCYHESKELSLAAFSTEQVEALKNGKIPGGRL